jgi:hypothetical protein
MASTSTSSSTVMTAELIPMYSIFFEKLVITQVVNKLIS